MAGIITKSYDSRFTLRRGESIYTAKYFSLAVENISVAVKIAANKNISPQQDKKSKIKKV